MAKKQFFRRIKLSAIIQYLYERGVFQSCIINSFILIVLACIVNGQYNKDLPPIKLSFISENQEDFDIEDISEIEIEQQENDQQNEVVNEFEGAISQLVSESTNDYSFIGQDIENDILNNIDQNLDSANATINEILDIENSDLIKVLSPVRVVARTISNRPNQHNRLQVLTTTEEGVGANINSNQNDSLNEINRRLSEYGAKTGDIQISLSWNTIDDIDLHVQVLPLRSNINWMNKFGQCGGVLDIDMNAHPNMLTNRPIENIFWANNMAQRGIYIVGIHNYMPWSRIPKTDVLIVIKVKQKVIFSKSQVIRQIDGVREVFRFKY
jgi:hypothetical protein